MKKFLGILSVLVLTMTNVAFAKSFSDVKNTNYSDSVEILTEFEIINGYEDNTFKPTKEIKRSEMAKLLIVAMGKEESVNKNVTKQPFPDVSVTHWAAGYIELASELDLIKGYPNGNFAPDDTVSYVEAVTMMLRALNYGSELDNLSWPDGYMQKAANAKLTENVSYNDVNADAIRGEISNMLWNTMKAHTREIKSTTSTGTVNYGDGKTLIEKAFSDKYTYIEDVVVVDVDVKNDTITLEIDNKEKTFNYEATDTELKKLYGRTIEVAIYDLKNEEFILFELDSAEKVVTGSVSDVVDNYLYIGSKAYKIPSDDYIKLIGISKIEYAQKVYMVLEGTKVKSMLVEGTDSEVFIGVVIDNDITVSKKDGIKVATLDGDKKYVLEDPDEKIYDGDVIVYSINDDDELAIREVIDIDDSLEISSVTASAIKLVGEDKVTLSKLDDYTIVVVKDEDTIEEVELNYADEEYDTAAIIEYGDTTFIVIFYNGLDEIDTDSSDDDDDDYDSEIYVGVVTDNDITVNSKDGIKLATTDGTKKYALASTSKKIYEGDVIIYTLNSSNKLVIEEIFDVSDSSKITTLTSTAIKVSGESKITLSSLDDYEIFMVKDESKISEAKLTDADKDYDTAVIEEVDDITFIIIFYDGIYDEDDDDSSSMTTSQAKSALKSAITAAKKKSESNYTIASWAKLETALATAEGINQSTATASKMQTAAENLNTAVKNLKTATTSDKTLRTKYNELQTLIKTVEAIEKDDYTEASYDTLTKELTSAKKIVLSSTTLDKVETAITNLNSAKKSLVTNTTAENMQEAIARLEKAVAEGNAKKAKKDEYTEKTYDDLITALKLAEDVDYNVDGSREINSVARNIEEALDALVTKADAEKDEAITELKSVVAEAKKLETNKSKYTEKTWKKVQDILDVLEPYNNVYKNLETSKITDYASELEKAINALEEENKRELLINNLKSTISLVEEKEEKNWTGTATFAELQTALNKAKDAYENRENKTYNELEEAYNDLVNCM